MGLNHHKTLVEANSESGYGGAPSFPSQSQSTNPYAGNPFGGAPSPDQGFNNPSSQFNNAPDFSSTINISDDDLPF